jgi:predicted N-acetyltransferase YhbS
MVDTLAIKKKGQLTASGERHAERAAGPAESPLDVRIRDARATDAPAILDVTLSAYREYGETLPEHWEGYRRNIQTTLANVAPARQFVAERDGEIVGAVLLYPAGATLPRPQGKALTLEWPQIRLLAVLPSSWGHGIGTALVGACLRAARDASAEAVTLNTTDLMRAATALYQRMGFARAPDLDFRPAPGVVAKGYLYRLTN